MEMSPFMGFVRLRGAQPWRRASNHAGQCFAAEECQWIDQGWAVLGVPCLAPQEAPQMCAEIYQSFLTPRNAARGMQTLPTPSDVDCSRGRSRL